MKQKTLSLIILLLVSNQIIALTWDEPWRKEVIQKSEYFIKGKVIKASDSLATVEIEKCFGNNLSGTIQIDGFFLLDICSSSGHGPELYLSDEMEAYFFLKKGKNGNYQLPTPTSGLDIIVEDKIHSTYRHSYHRASVSPDVYELTFKALWSFYKKIDFDKKDISNFIDTTLKKEPVEFGKGDINVFFEQHAALESAYLLGIDLDENLVKEFINSDNQHLQISGLRALSQSSTKSSKIFLLKYINKSDDNFNTVIAIWSLWEYGGRKYQRKLWKLRKQISTEQTGFSSNIMDSRICTYFPSPKSAIIDLKKHNISKM